MGEGVQSLTIGALQESNLRFCYISLTNLSTQSLTTGFGSSVGQRADPESQGRRFNSCQGPRPKSCIFHFCYWLGLINVYKFPVDNFHLFECQSFLEHYFSLSCDFSLGTIRKLRQREIPLRTESSAQWKTAFKEGGKGGYGSRFTTKKSRFTIHMS